MDETPFEQIMANQERCEYRYDNGLVCGMRARMHESMREHPFQPDPPTLREDVARWWRARSFFKKRTRPRENGDSR